MSTLLDELTEKPSDRTITADLMARLQRHYIKPGQPLPGGVFIPEVGWNGGVHSSRVDALYVGFTGSSGRMLIGHEVKASRSDWLNELNKPGKADAWADQCHEWWLVSPPGIVLPGELPDGWGHMVPGASKTRMRVVVPARRHHDRVPSWDATRSVIARQDTLRSDAIFAGQRKANEDAALAADERIEREVEYRMRQVPDAAALQDRVARIEAALGGTLVEADGRWFGRGNGITEVALADVAELLRIRGTLNAAARSLTARYAGAPLTRLRRDLDELDAAYRAAVEAIPNDNPDEAGDEF